jgi:hypothetical protein
LSDETALEVEFGDGLHRFFLPMARIVEIERNCGDKSIVAMLDEFSLGMGWTAEQEPAFAGGGPVRIKDVAEVIRCGAIGGGMAPLEAKRLVDSYVDGRPYSETVPIAWAILSSAIWGVRLKKKAERPEPVKPARRSARARSSPTAAS